MAVLLCRVSNITDTDYLCIDRFVIAKLLDNASDANLLAALLDTTELPDAAQSPCIHHNPRVGALPVPLKGSYNRHAKAFVSVARLAFAAARCNRLTGLRAHEHAAHTCGADIYVDGRRLVCINPAHLVKRNLSDAA